MSSSFYHEEHGIDVRYLRFPVLIRPAQTATLREQIPKIVSDQRRPVLRIDDAVRATRELMFAPPEAVRERICHVSGTNILVAELITEIQFHHAAAGIEIWDFPEHPGHERLDDSLARAEWPKLTDWRKKW